MKESDSEDNFLPRFFRVGNFYMRKSGYLLGNIISL